MSSTFEYRALDLLADYEPRFVAFPNLWRTQIEKSSNIHIFGAFSNLLYSMVTEASCELDPLLSDDEFSAKLGNLDDRDRHAIKLLGDLGLLNPIATITISYFVGRRNILDDERCWVRYTQLIDDEISIRAC